MTMPTRPGAPKGSRYYDVSQVAAILGVSAMTVYRSIRDGQIPAVKVRSRLLVPVDAVDNLSPHATSPEVE